jgi:hypothetical protein
LAVDLGFVADFGLLGVAALWHAANASPAITTLSQGRTARADPISCCIGMAQSLVPVASCRHHVDPLAAGW